jgi:hypothetical protein
MNNYAICQICIQESDEKKVLKSDKAEEGLGLLTQMMKESKLAMPLINMGIIISEGFGGVAVVGLQILLASPLFPNPFSPNFSPSGVFACRVQKKQQICLSRLQNSIRLLLGTRWAVSLKTATGDPKI